MEVKVLVLSLCVAIVTFVCALELLRFIPLQYLINAVANMLTSDFQALPPSVSHRVIAR